MKYDFFIASRWRNKATVLDFARKIEAKGKTVYNFIEGDGSDYELKDMEEKYEPEEFMKMFESIPDWQNSKAIKEIFKVDIDALKDSETVLLLLPAGKSAHVEAGVSYGMGKRTILIGEQKEAEPLYMIFDEMYGSIDQFIESL